MTRLLLALCCWSARRGKGRKKKELFRGKEAFLAVVEEWSTCVEKGGRERGEEEQREERGKEAFKQKELGGRRKRKVEEACLGQSSGHGILLLLLPVSGKRRGARFLLAFSLSHPKAMEEAGKKVGKWDRVERSFLFRLRPSGGVPLPPLSPLLLFLLSRERGADPASEEREGNPVGQLAKLSFARHTTRMGLGVLEKIPMLCNILCRAQILSWLLNA